MRYYIVDDEIGVVKTLENIIQKRLGGTVDGYETNPAEARERNSADQAGCPAGGFLMTEMDGVTLVKQLRGQLPQTSFIMLSKVSDKSMVEQAYQAGIGIFYQQTDQFGRN